MEMIYYKIVRYYQSGKSRTIYKNLTLEQAQEHCRNRETNSKTCTLPKYKKLTKKHGAWFDGYTVQK